MLMLVCWNMHCIEVQGAQSNFTSKHGHFIENIVLGSNLEMILGSAFHRGDLFLFSFSILMDFGSASAQ